MTEVCEACNRKMCTLCGCNVCDGEEESDEDEIESSENDVEGNEDSTINSGVSEASDADQQHTRRRAPRRVALRAVDQHAIAEAQRSD